jgi:hypothetical protein
MVRQNLKKNAATLQNELNWFRQILDVRSRLNNRTEKRYRSVREIPPPPLKKGESPYADFVLDHGFNFDERFVLLLSLIPHIKPELLDIFMKVNESTGQLFTEFGGRRSANHAAFMPTGETAFFILSGSDLAERFTLMRLFEPDHFFSTERILWLEGTGKGDPVLSGVLHPSKEILDLVTLGEYSKPVFSADFPARLLETGMEWTDLVLPREVHSQLSQLQTWIRERRKVMNEWGMGKYLNPGYKALFYGKPGTGKTLTAALLGKKTGRDVYRIDLSQMVSKYIGETEKNLSALFDRAENKDWILFFDEADSLFGNRTATRDAHDRYANQQVSYLLQRIEQFNGLIILATNLKGNIDTAFMRRFQMVVHFPLPDEHQRLEMWSGVLNQGAALKRDVDLKQIAADYKISGGSIMNAVQYAMLSTIEAGQEEIEQKYLLEGIKREFSKDRRTI